MTAAEAVSEHARGSLQLYEELISSGVCREQARGVLPQNMYTEYYGTVNLNNLFKFIELRNHLGAQWEIQRVAQACQSLVESLFPLAYNAWKISGKKAHIVNT